MEQKKDYAKVYTAFEKLLQVQAKTLDELQKNPEDGSFNGSQPSSHSTNTAFGSPQSATTPPRLTELQERRTEYGLVYMRFARRAEGLQAMRKVFGKARKDKWAPWEVYEASGESSHKFCSMFAYTLLQPSWNIIVSTNSLSPAGSSTRAWNALLAKLSMSVATWDS